MPLVNSWHWQSLWFHGFLVCADWLDFRSRQCDSFAIAIGCFYTSNTEEELSAFLKTPGSPLAMCQWYSSRIFAGSAALWYCHKGNSAARAAVSRNMRVQLLLLLRVAAELKSWIRMNTALVWLVGISTLHAMPSQHDTHSWERSIIRDQHQKHDCNEF